MHSSPYCLHTVEDALFAYSTTGDSTPCKGRMNGVAFQSARISRPWFDCRARGNMSGTCTGSDALGPGAGKP